MIDPVSAVTLIQTSIATLKGMSELLKKSKEIDKAMTQVDMREQLVEVQESLVDAKNKAIELTEENRDLRYQLQLREELHHDRDANILWREKESKKEGPYCSTCHGAENKLISLSGDDEKGSWHCPKCKNFFRTKEWHKEQVRKHQNLGQIFSR